MRLVKEEEETGLAGGELTQAAALIGLVVVFAFGYRVVRRVISGASRGKAKI